MDTFYAAVILEVFNLLRKLLSNFARVMAVRIRVLENKNSMVHWLLIFDLGKPRSLENVFLSVWFASIHQCEYGWY